jgi:hypothetical protein
MGEIGCTFCHVLCTINTASTSSISVLIFEHVANHQKKPPSENASEENGGPDRRSLGRVPPDKELFK